VKVKHLSGEPWFGAWRASSVTSTTHRPQNYRVHIRSLIKRSNYCTCPDFAVNQLGTCKHIEAVLHKVSKRRNYNRIKDQPSPYPFVYLAWDVEKAYQRVVAETKEFVIVHPYASHVPYETWILPKMHRASFGLFPATHLAELSMVLKDTLFCLYRGLDNPAFNLMIDSTTTKDEDDPYYPRQVIEMLCGAYIGGSADAWDPIKYWLDDEDVEENFGLEGQKICNQALVKVGRDMADTTESTSRPS